MPTPVKLCQTMVLPTISEMEQNDTKHGYVCPYAIIIATTRECFIDLDEMYHVNPYRDHTIKVENTPMGWIITLSAMDPNHLLERYGSLEYLSEKEHYAPVVEIKASYD